MKIEIVDSKILLDGKCLNLVSEVLANEDLIIENMPNLNFSRSLWSLEFYCEENVSKIEIKTFATFRNTKILLNFSAKFQGDYAIIDGNLITFSQSSQMILNELSDMDFFSNNETTIKQFVTLERILEVNGIRIENRRALKSFFGQGSIPERKSLSSLKLAPFQYQTIGAEWISSCFELGDGGVLLSDVMGLGKTLQSIAVINELSTINNQNRLVVCPGTLVANWKREITKFAPNLKVLIHTGPWRYGVEKSLKGFDLIITTFETLNNDIGLLSGLDWQIVIVDEAQAIKNPKAQRTKSLKRLNARFRLAVTGTPIENSLEDIWSIFDFLRPGFLGTLSQFELDSKNIASQAEDLHQTLSAYMLRRDLADVGSQLPPITLVNHSLDWPSALDGIYEDVRVEALAEFRRSGGLVATTRLRKLTTHPRLHGIETIDNVALSPKFAVLKDLVEELFRNGDKALIFASYNRMIDLIVEEFSSIYPDYLIANLDGRVANEKRQPLIDDFNSVLTPGLLACNPIVAGAGLNITGANHVIHYNLEWNPAKEDQASFRVYRPGQVKNVFIHRFYYANTIDEVIDERVSFKRNLASQTVDGSLTEEDFLAGLEVSPGNFRSQN
jgi:SNF2 family DNA or RNA helicase